jgi:protein-S-isoprenylcysteine O-methyltransferase Ste14
MLQITIGVMPTSTYLIVAAGWLIWMVPFFLVQRKKQVATQVDRRARWGILLVAVAYSIVWQGKFWERSLPGWRIPLGILFLILAAVLSWTGTRSLGRQWRVDAGLNSDHELITSGPYRLVRHPIYTSMLCLLLGTGFLVATLPLLLLATLVFLIGTEIRVRIEDKLLASHFGEQFQDYKRRVGAYIPLLK